MITSKLAFGCAASLVSLALMTSRLDAAWTVQTIDNASTSGLAVSLALNASDTPFVSYVRPTPGFSGFFDTYYATSSGNTWIRESVFTSTNNPGDTTSISLTELGNPVVAFTKSGTFLRCYIRSSGSWGPLDAGTDDITTAGGDFVSGIWRGTEAAPDPLIAFSDDGAGDLERAYMTAGNFATSTLDANNAGFSCSLAAYNAYAAILSLKGGKLLFLESLDGTNFGPHTDPMFDPLLAINATYCALAVAPATKSDPANIRAHLIYFNGGTYYYLTNDTDTGVWTTAEIIYSGGLQTVSYFGLSIAVGTDGVPRVAFLDYGDKSLKYAERTATGWPVNPVTVDPSGGITCSLKLNAQNQPRIAYGALVYDTMSFSWGAGALKYAAFSSTPPVSLSFKVNGKATRSTTKSKLTVKGTASSNALAIQWRVGKKALKKSKVTNGRWSVKVSPLAPGKNKVKFRAIGAGGKTTAFKTLTVERK